MDRSDPDWVGLVGPAGVTSSVDLRDSRSNISRADGEVIGSSFWGTRSIVIDIFIIDNDPVSRADKLEHLQKVNYLLRTPGTLSWIEDGSESYEKQVSVRLQSFPTISHNDNPTKNYQIVLTALEPQIESVIETTESFASDSTATTYTFSITNNGNWFAWPKIRVVNKLQNSSLPLYNLSITNNTNERSIIINDVDQATSLDAEIIIDTKPTARTVVQKIGTTETNIYNQLDIDSLFFPLESGSNSITIGYENTVSFDVDELEWEIIYRDAWI